MANFIKFDGVDGESQDANHEKWCELESFNYAMDVPTDLSGSGLTGGAPNVGPVTVSIPSGAHTHALDDAILRGRIFPKVEIHKTMAVDDATTDTHFIMILENVKLGDFASSSMGDGPAMESMSLHAGKISREYKIQKTEGGPLTTVGKTAFDMKKKEAS